MAASTCRRSESVRATKGETIPAPRSKPSSATYMANRSAAIVYHSSNMGELRADASRRHEWGRAMGDLAPNQEEEQDPQGQVEATEPHQREEHGARVDSGTRALRGPKQSVDEPGLSAELGGHPSGGVGDVGEWKREQEDPQHRPAVLETTPPAEQQSCEGDGREDRAESGHDVEGVVQELDVVGPDVLRERVEAWHIGVESP